MDHSAWDEVTAAVAAAPYPVRQLPPDPARAEEALVLLGITTRSWLGAVVAHTGGLLIDHGWLRVLGSGNDGLPDVTAEADPRVRGLVVAYDVLGGQFAWVPREPGEPPTVHYFGPDVLEWQDLQQGYTDWLYAVLAGSLTRFYDTLRWPGWEVEVDALPPGQGITSYPPPWSREGKDLSTASRAPAPLVQLAAFHQDTLRQLGSPNQPS